MTHHTGRIARALASVAVLSLIAACAKPASAPPAADAAKDTADLTALVTQYNANYKAHDADKIVAGNASDLITYAPGAAVEKGPGDAKALAARFAADPAMNVVVTPDRIEVAKSGDLAYIVGHADQTATNPKTHSVEHSASGYVVDFRKGADGTWKAVAISVSPGPEAGPAKR